MAEQEEDREKVSAPEGFITNGEGTSDIKKEIDRREGSRACRVLFTPFGESSWCATMLPPSPLPSQHITLPLAFI